MAAVPPAQPARIDVNRREQRHAGRALFETAAESAFEYATRGETSAPFYAEVPARAVNLSLRMLWRTAPHFAMHGGFVV
jgi:hypothetical protein